jgi:tetratricopeptide (TPR) repeat protein
MNGVKPKGMGAASWLAPSLLLLTVLVVYSRVATFGFVNYDDPAYTFENPHVNVGLTPGGIIWAFTQSYAANWHPLTWISHMLDFQLFGAQSGMQHITNVLFHAATTLLLFFFLKKITGSTGCGLFVAFGFALHPLHVESVAWISERKDVLSAFFFILTLWAYVDYARDPRPVRYWWVVGLFVCALLSKQMAVTLPLVALVIDFWPLRRGLAIRAAVREKLPLIALSIGAAIVAYLAQRGAGAVSSFEKLPLSIRLMNVPVAYATYLVQFVWPMNLTVFYPYDPSPNWWQPVAASSGLIAISIFVWNQRAKRPYLLAGWLWYLITLLPVVGIIQIGAQAHADRYTYIPLIGVLIALAWGARDLAASVFADAPARYLAAGVAVFCALFWTVLAWIQIGYWADSLALFEHAVHVTANNYVAYNDLGVALWKAGRLPEAIVAYQESVRSQPVFADAHYNLGTALMDTPGRQADAIQEMQTALKLDPENAKAKNNLGKLLAEGSAPVPAQVEHFEAALRGDPNQVEAHINLANALGQQGKFEDALREYQTALRLDPSRAITHVNLANVLASMPGRMDEAIAEYRAAIKIAPDLAAAHYNLGSALAGAGRTDDAMVEYRLAIKADPHLVQAQNDLGVVLAQMPGRLEEAIAEFEAAIRQQPNFFDAHLNLGRALGEIPGRSTAAIAEFEAAVRINPQSAMAHYQLGVALAKAPGRKADAIRELEKAYGMQPDPRIKAMIQQLGGSR